MNAVISFIIDYDFLILSLPLFTFCAAAELSDIYKNNKLLLYISSVNLRRWFIWNSYKRLYGVE